MNADTLAVLQASLARAKFASASGDTLEAHRAFSQAHLSSPTDPEILLDLANACLSCQEPAKALAHGQAAALLTHGWRLEMVLATAFSRLQMADSAALHFHKAIEDPSLPAALCISALKQLADLQLNAFGDARSAAISLQRAARLDPALALQADLALLIADLYEGTRQSPEIASGFSALAAQLKPPANMPKPNRRPTRQRLRIGLVSQQFCASPVGFLTLGPVAELARRADLYFFDRGAKADWAQAAFKACARQWLVCGMLNSSQLHRLLVAADLDALIDCSGWTDPACLQALAGRPAPRQLKWVGGQSLSTGMRCFDGFVTDQRQVPGAAARFYTEPLLFARQGYVTYTAPPYAPALAAAAAKPPKPQGVPAPGVVAIVSNPAKISRLTSAALQGLRPRKLLLIDHRWRHQGTRQAAEHRLGRLLDVAEFLTPANHPQYLEALLETDATFLDTSPYSMGLSAIELSLLGKHVLAAPRSPSALMCERHCVAHLGAKRFDHHQALSAQLLGWCSA